MTRKRTWKKAAKKAPKEDKKQEEAEEQEVPLTRYEKDTSDEESGRDDSDGGGDDDDTSDSEDEEAPSKAKKARRGADEKEDKSSSKWTNKQRVLVFGSRGIGPRDRHLMDDVRSLMPHARTDSKMQRKETLFVINEIAEMKNCNKCLFFEGRKGRKDLYLWASNVARGPSAKFQVENVHTMAELKMTGNCLKSSRPILSFDKEFQKEAHWKLLRELFTQIFSVPNHHPKSQPFFDHVYTFSVVDDKVWFRNFQIVEEDGSLAEIGPRFVLNPIKVFESSFSGQTLWDNPKYVTPTAHRSAMKKMKAGKYQQHVQAKAAYEASRPAAGSVYALDKTDEVFETIVDEEAEERKRAVMDKKKPLKKRNRKKNKENKGAEAGDDGQQQEALVDA